jgi:protein-L-isoaspartate(D-aspartate) O-methyltransferase
MAAAHADEGCCVTIPPRSARSFPLRLDQLEARPALAGDTEPDPKQRLGTVRRPQRTLQMAHGGAINAPTGIGLDSADVRQRMVQRLRQAGIRNEAVLGAFADVARHLFLDPGFVVQAYQDTSLPIGHGQTISKPSVIARMFELLFEGANARAAASLGRVLEIGTGCGYQAALLTRVSRHVVSIERIKALHDRARAALSASRGDSLRLVFGDGTLGHAPNAPYDSIIAAAGGDAVPQAWLDQLAIGGRLVAPVREPACNSQVLVVIDRNEDGWVRSRHEAVTFVPLKSGLIA